MRAGKDCGWWTRSQSIRTEGAEPSVAPKSRSYCCDEERRMEVPFEVALVDSPVVPTCMGIAEKTLHLKELNMNPNRIAVALKVDRTTVTRALRWILANSLQRVSAFRTSKSKDRIRHMTLALRAYSFRTALAPIFPSPET